MLKTMRRNVQSLKPILWVIIATFVIAIFAIWGGGGELGGKSNSNVVVKVGKTPITTDEYATALRRTIENMQRQFKELNRGLIEQLNLPQQTIERLVQEDVLLTVAKEMGLRATDAEVREELLRLPYFQRDGKFIGFQEYEQVLQYNHVTVGDFENDLKKSVLLNKVMRVLTAGTTVTEQEVWDAWQKSKESAKIEYVVAESAKMPEPAKPDDARVAAWFEGHKTTYKVPEKRSGDYVAFKIDDLKKEVAVNDQDVEKYYTENKAQFTTPARVKVSRIYLPFNDKDKDAVLARAKELAAQAQGGADFAELAKANSKDDKASTGGDYGFDGWRSLPQDEVAAVEPLEAGKVTDVVTGASAASILKVTEKDPETTRPLADVRAQVKTILEDQKARALAAERAAALEKRARSEKSLDLACQKSGIKFVKSGLLKRGDPLGDVDTSGAVSEALFGLKEKEIGAPVSTYAGSVVVQLTAVAPEHAAALDEVKDQVATDLQTADRKEAAKAKIEELRAKLGDKKFADKWDEAAKAVGLEYKSVEEHKREQYLSPIGESAEVDRLAFSLPVKETSQPVAVDSGYLVMRVLDRKLATREEFDKVKDTERTTLLETKRNEMLQSYLAQARDRMKIEVNYQKYLDVNQEILSRYSGEGDSTGQQPQ